MADPTADAVTGGTIAGASLGVVAAVGLGVGAGPFIGMGVVGAGLGGAIGLGAAALDYRAPNPTGQAGFPCMVNHTHVWADHHRLWGGSVTLDFANLSPRKVKVWLCFTIGMDRSETPNGPTVHFGLYFQRLNGGSIRTSWGQSTGEVFVSRYSDGVYFQTGDWKEALNCFQRLFGRGILPSYKYGHQCIYLGEVGAEVLSRLAPVITSDLSALFDVQCLRKHFGAASSGYIAVMGLLKAVSVGPRHFPANRTNCWVFSIRIIKCLGLHVSTASLFQGLLSMKDVSDESLLSTKEAFGYASLWKRCWESITI